jgi:hypothetical protein
VLGLWTLIIAATPAAHGAYDDTWARSLGPGAAVRLPVGTYAGPWHLGPGVHLVADSGAILEARQSGAPALVIEGSGVTIEGLAIRAAPGAIGIEATDRARLTLRDFQISGGTRGLEVHGGDVSWSGGTVEGTSDYAVWAKASHLRLRAVRLRDNRGPAVYVADTQAELFRCSLATSEYGVLGIRSQVDLTENEFLKDRRAGIGLSLSSGHLSQNHFSGPFFEAAITLLSSQSLRIERNRIEQAGSAGIKLLGSTASLEDNLVSGARSTRGLEGTGLYLHASTVHSRGDILRDNDGTALVVIGGAVTLQDCRIERSGEAAASVASRGVLVLSHCVVREGSTDVDVEPDSTLKVEETRFERTGLDAGGEQRAPPAPASGRVE